MSGDEQSVKSDVRLDRIGQIALTVSDIAHAKDFYQNTLGMRHLFDAGTMSFFQCGEVRMMIGAKEKPIQSGGTILYFHVDDIHAAHEALEARGVAFTHKPHLVAKMPDHELWMAFFADPDGNPIALMCEVR
ncbi:MAG TPA: VOC family protein [Terracidiphilus sp.]|nr:VOC family protein [Terracidiphilus sp.]